MKSDKTKICGLCAMQFLFYEIKSYQQLPYPVFIHT